MTHTERKKVTLDRNLTIHKIFESLREIGFEADFCLNYLSKKYNLSFDRLKCIVYNEKIEITEPVNHLNN